MCLSEFYTENLDNEKFQHGLYLRGNDTLGKEEVPLSTLCLIAFSTYIFLDFEENNKSTSIQERGGSFTKSLWYKHSISLSLT